MDVPYPEYDDDDFCTEATTSLYSDDLTLLKQGAEAKVYKAMFLGRPAIVKERFPKMYRHPDLEKQLTKERMKSELRCITRCKQAGIEVPCVYFVNTVKSQIVMEFIEESVTLNEHICRTFSEHRKEALMKLCPLAEEIGKILALMHKSNIIHGDLTTSNILLRKDTDDVRIVFIDFGLSYCDRLAEDKGVDLYVLEKAFLSTHPNSEALFDKILSSYRTNSGKGGEAVMKKLDEVRMRGRKRVMVG